MKNVIKMIDDFFVSNDYAYDFNEESNAFSSGVNMSNVLGVLLISIVVYQDFYKVKVILNNHVERKYFSAVSEYLHRANCGLHNGNFEIDYSDGEISYKTFVNFDGVTLSKTVVEESIVIPVFMFERYGKNLLKVMTGSRSIAALIEDAEKTVE